jgi:hypothetical protein
MLLMQNDLIVGSTLRVNQKTAETTALSSPFGPSIEICRAQTNSQGAYAYRLDSEDKVLELLAWRGSRSTDIPAYSVQVEGRPSSWSRDLTANTILSKSALQDWQFPNPPTLLQNRLKSASQKAAAR